MDTEKCWEGAATELKVLRHNNGSDGIHGAEALTCKCTTTIAYGTHTTDLTISACSNQIWHPYVICTCCEVTHTSGRLDTHAQLPCFLHAIEPARAHDPRPGIRHSHACGGLQKCGTGLAPCMHAGTMACSPNRCFRFCWWIHKAVSFKAEMLPHLIQAEACCQRMEATQTPCKHLLQAAEPMPS